MPTVIQRAIIKGTLLDAVNLRMMFSGEVIGDDVSDTSAIWTEYLDGIFTADALGAFAASMIFNTYELQQLDTGHWITRDEVSYPKVGLSAGEAAPNHTAAVLIGKSLGIRKIGRKFLSGVVTSHIDGNAVDSTVMGNLAAMLLAYISPVLAVDELDLYPGIVAGTGTFYRFLGGFVSAFLGTMRRRKPGVGF